MQKLKENLLTMQKKKTKKLQPDYIKASNQIDFEAHLIALKEIIHA